MKILTGENIRLADMYTISAEPVSSIALMERAAVALTGRTASLFGPQYRIVVVAGKGNNAGDGIAMARLLSERGYACDLYLVYSPEEMSFECGINLRRLPEDVRVFRFSSFAASAGEYDPDRTVIVDALLGTGVRGTVRGEAALVIRQMNAAPFPVISVDLPSGLPTEFAELETGDIVRADITLTIEFPKLSLLVPETGIYAGDMEIVTISLSEEFKSAAKERFIYVDSDCAEGFECGKRDRFSHKGNYGHVLLVCGNTRMMGAAILSVSAALRSGCGLVTAHIPSSGMCAMNIANPSAMVSPDPADCFSVLPEKMERYTSVCAGCGMGTDKRSAEALAGLMSFGKPMVLDADALNIISENRQMLALLPEGSVLTPHPGELRRLVGGWRSARERIGKAIAFASRYGVVLLIKGAYTMTVTPEGYVYVNSTGSPAMAKGGCGDILAGYIAGLMARGYNAVEAAVLGVYRHGLAGDRAAARYGVESVNSSDIVDCLRY